MDVSYIALAVVAGAPASSPRYCDVGRDDTGPRTKWRAGLLVPRRRSTCGGAGCYTLGIVSATRLALRVANTNHRSRREDFDALLDAVVMRGNELSEQ
jgi:hypothetical protein